MTLDLGSAEPHALDEDTFYGEVQSFSFWFEAIEGYLADKTDGHDPDAVEVAMSDHDREGLIATLCNYCVGESAALEASGGLVRLAPNHNAQIFMATQVADEARHLEVFLRRLRSLGVDDPEAEVERRANPSIVAFKRRLLDFVDQGDWEAAVFAQNVILETMEYTVFRFHERWADPITSQVLDGVACDERRHLGFGENDLGRRLAAHPDHRERLSVIKDELDAHVLRSFDHAFDDLGLSAADRPPLGRDYLHAVERLGFTT